MDGKAQSFWRIRAGDPGQSILSAPWASQAQKKEAGLIEPGLFAIAIDLL
jgi:hypothetical protein